MAWARLMVTPAAIFTTLKPIKWMKVGFETMEEIVWVVTIEPPEEIR